MEGVGSGNYRGPSKSVSRPQHYWHSELDYVCWGGGGSSAMYSVSSIPDLYPRDAISATFPSLVVTTKNVSRHCYLSFGGQNGPQLRSTVLNEQTKAKAVNKLVQQCQLESSGQTGRRKRWFLSPKHPTLTTTSAYFHGNSSESLIYFPQVPDLFLGLVSSENTSTRTELSI